MSRNQVALSTELNLNEIQAIGQWGLPEMLAMKEVVGKDLSIPQYNLFMYDCSRLKLDPRLKHAFPILYGGKMDFRISFEGYHAMAQESEGYAGLYMDHVGENEAEDFFIETDDSGNVTKINHKKRFPRGKTVGAYAIARREGRADVVVPVDVSQVQKYVKKNPNFWKLDDNSIDPDMIKKFAGIRAIKMQYDIAAVAEESTEEMFSAPADIQPYERKDITEEVDTARMRLEPDQLAAYDAAKKQTDSKQNNPTPPPVEEESEEDKIAKVNAEITAKFKVLGITKKADQTKYIEEHVKITKGKAPTLADRIGLLKIMDMQIAEQQAQQSDFGDDDDLLSGIE